MVEGMREFWQFEKGNFDSLQRKILTVCKGNFDSLQRKFWQFAKEILTVCKGNFDNWGFGDHYPRLTQTKSFSMINPK